MRMSTSSIHSNSATSPRLPSPPPFPEIQIPQSQSGDINATHIKSPLSPASRSAMPHGGNLSNNNPTIRRIRPGAKARDISTGPPLVSLSELDSAFQLQEHLASILAHSTTSSSASSVSSDYERTTPLTKASCITIASPPDGVDEWLWCYELTRRVTKDLNILIVALLNDNCTAQSCPQMRASEWQYLCAVHDPPQSCCAINYSTHTLDHAATILTSTRYFPSRLTLNANGTKHLSSIFRRLYRIFAHAWFQHKSVFWEVENEHGLYVFFKTISERYGLIPEDNLTIPPEAELHACHPSAQSRGHEDPDLDLNERDHNNDDLSEFSRGPKLKKGSLVPVGLGDTEAHDAEKGEYGDRDSDDSEDSEDDDEDDDDEDDDDVDDDDEDDDDDDDDDEDLEGELDEDIARLGHEEEEDDFNGPSGSKGYRLDEWVGESEGDARVPEELRPQGEPQGRPLQQEEDDEEWEFDGPESVPPTKSTEEEEKDLEGEEKNEDEPTNPTRSAILSPEDNNGKMSTITTANPSETPLPSPPPSTSLEPPPPPPDIPLPATPASDPEDLPSDPEESSPPAFTPPTPFPTPSEEKNVPQDEDNEKDEINKLEAERGDGGEDGGEDDEIPLPRTEAGREMMNLDSVDEGAEGKDKAGE